MKTSLLYIGILFLLTSCRENEFKPQSGDLLFQANKTSELTNAITEVTAKSDSIKFSHVGIVVIENEEVFVLEASPEGGVHLTSIAEFLESSAKTDDRPVVVAARLRDKSQAASAVKRAKQYIGRAYDWAYSPNNVAIYCSELVYISYLDTENNHIFTARPMTFCNPDGQVNQFWADHFSKRGEQIPESIDGTNPNDMAHDKAINIVHIY